MISPGACAFIATDRLGRLERRQPIEAQAFEAQAFEAQAFEDATDGGGRDADFRGDLIAGVALPAQSLNPFAGPRTCLAWR
jgi:hypothetical protein